MIFIGGIHGVGKSFYCTKVECELSIRTYSASGLISERKKSDFASDKLIPDIDDNQQYLLSAVDELNLLGKEYVLDGHFCLLNAQGEVTRIPVETFLNLRPNAIILLTENPEIIAERRRQRDGVNRSIEEIKRFQDEEIRYATEIATVLKVPFIISLGEDDLVKTLHFIRANRGGVI